MIAKPGVVSGALGLVVGAAVVVSSVTDSDALENACYLGVLIGASIGAWIGAERAARGRRLVPRLIAAGVSLTALGDVLFRVLDHMGAGTDVSIADPPWFASYLAVCAALCVVLGRSRGRSSSRVDVDFMIDVVTIVTVSVLIFWSIAVDTIAADNSLTPYVRMVWAAYPIVDAILLALVVRVLMSRSGRAAIDPWFAVGIGLWLAADLAYLLAAHSGTAQVLMNAAWMVGPVLIARAAWRDNSDKQIDRSGSALLGGWKGQLTVAVAPLFVPAALELVADLRGEPDQPLKLFIGTALLVTLAFVRSARMLRSEEFTRLELEEARDAALDASRAALAASQAKSMFLANMSHEIRTPLTTVLATREMLEDTPLDDLQLGLLEKMHRSGDLLQSLVEGILDFSRIEAGQVQLASTEFDLHALVTDTADVYVPRAVQTDIRFMWDLDPRVPKMVVGDPARLFQVLTNILDNALKFTHHGHLRLVVCPAKTDDERGADERVEFVVEDTGIGIRKEHQASVFDSFSQVDGSITRRYGGNGLGLAICKELTELMGGSITLHSRFGVGSTFVVRIPLARAIRDHIAPPHPTAVTSPGGEGAVHHPGNAAITSSARAGSSSPLLPCASEAASRTRELRA